MTTKHRFKNKYTLQIRERDHNPPHVHLCGGGVDMTIDIETLTCTGLAPADLKREAVLYISEHFDEIMEEWKKWHS